MRYVSSDDREEYPVHVPKTSSGWIKSSKEQTPYYECRTYDKNGRLVKIELRPPTYKEK